ncbi:hypothetical protein C8Q76DRAFT_174030 [Earliella scabrosa]|nr:hypothetical protein C8Q76DRAFT_174030 [Earliella scabrosa]
MPDVARAARAQHPSSTSGTPLNHHIFWPPTQPSPCTRSRLGTRLLPSRDLRPLLVHAHQLPSPWLTVCSSSGRIGLARLSTKKMLPLPRSERPRTSTSERLTPNLPERAPCLGPNFIARPLAFLEDRRTPKPPRTHVCRSIPSAAPRIQFPDPARGSRLAAGRGVPSRQTIRPVYRRRARDGDGGQMLCSCVILCNIVLSPRDVRRSTHAGRDPPARGPQATSGAGSARGFPAPRTRIEIAPDGHGHGHGGTRERGD